MFTGIVQTIGAVAAVRDAARARRITVRAGSTVRGARVGESIAVNGVCLTITGLGRGTFQADVGPETLRRTTVGRLRPGDRVNLERPLTLSQPLGGHLVQGHVDAVGRVVARRGEGDAVWMEIAAPPPVMRYVVEKGSVAVDGVSLTVAGHRRGAFTVNLIPHTLAVTTLGFRQPGDEVNLEADILAKYVERLVRSGGA